MGAYRGDSPNILGVIRRLLRGGPPKKCQGAKMHCCSERRDKNNAYCDISYAGSGFNTMPKNTSDITIKSSKYLQIITYICLNWKVYIQTSTCLNVADFCLNHSNKFVVCWAHCSFVARAGEGKGQILTQLALWHLSFIPSHQWTQ